ncbi:MAG: hypothetical protein QF516_14460, partial [Pirellulaceae bacterium]|nr:hypothetical protein [Pirellulaceae bacterium]
VFVFCWWSAWVGLPPNLNTYTPNTTETPKIKKIRPRLHIAASLLLARTKSFSRLLVEQREHRGKAI